MKQKCEVCGKELKTLTEDYVYCDNPNCKLYDKGWEKVTPKETRDL